MQCKRVLYITAALPPTRVPEADHALHQCLRMASLGVDVHVLTRKGQGLQRHPTLTIHEVADSWSWRELPRVVSLIRRVRPDAMMIYFLGSLYGYRPMPTLLPVILRILHPRARVVAQFAAFGQGRGLRGRVRPFLFRKLGRLKYGSLLVVPDAIVIMSEEHRVRLSALAPAMLPKAHVIPCSSQIEPALDAASARAAGRRRLRLRDDEFAVTFFGRLYPGKGIEQLIEAIALLRQDWPNIRLLLVGGFLDHRVQFNVTASYEEDLTATIERLGISDIVRRTGEFSWDGEEASEYLLASDVAALPLPRGIHLYNSSLAAVCSHGIPVIGTRTATVDPALQHRETVLFIDDSQPHHIADALSALLRDETLRATLATGSRRLGVEQFDWRNSTQRLVGLMHLGSDGE